MKPIKVTPSISGKEGAKQEVHTPEDACDKLAGKCGQIMEGGDLETGSIEEITKILLNFGIAFSLDFFEKYRDLAEKPLIMNLTLNDIIRLALGLERGHEIRSEEIMEFLRTVFEEEYTVDEIDRFKEGLVVVEFVPETKKVPKPSKRLKPEIVPEKPKTQKAPSNEFEGLGEKAILKKLGIEGITALVIRSGIAVHSDLSQMKALDFAKRQFTLRKGLNIKGKKIISFVLGRSIPNVTQPIFIEFIKLLPLPATVD